MVALLHFEEKVHRKKLQRGDTIPLLFLRLLCHILEHMGYHTEPHLERRHHCREHFTLNKWTQLAGYSTLVAVPSQVEEAQQDKLPIEYVLPAPAQPMPEAASTIPPATPPVPPVAPPTLEASITISADYYSKSALW